MYLSTFSLTIVQIKRGKIIPLHILFFSLILVQVTRGEIFVTQPGGFPCKAIMHVCGEKDTAIIETLARDILLQCERSGYQSVAIPAICAGQYLCI